MMKRCMYECSNRWMKVKMYSKSKDADFSSFGNAVKRKSY